MVGTISILLWRGWSLGWDWGVRYEALVGIASNIRWPEGQVDIVYGSKRYSMSPMSCRLSVVARIQNAQRGLYASMLGISQKRVDCTSISKVPGLPGRLILCRILRLEELGVNVPEL